MISGVDERIYSARKIAKENGIPVIRDKSFELLLTTACAKQPKKILEIGAAWGYSGIALLNVCNGAHLTTMEIDDDCIKHSRQNYIEFGVNDRVTLFTGDASEIIPLLSGEFDFIYLDGPKGHYYEFLPHLLNVLTKGGVLFADNVLFNGYVTGERVPTSKNKHNTIINSLRNYLKAITSDENLVSTVLDIEDGVAITVKKN
ncbi:MAG: O-methyltransferase [Clostridia bacterium]|nr:O-methyltransferase [Clostridia bacterium]